MELSSLIERYRQWTTAIARSHPKVVTSSTAILAVLALVFPRCRKDYRTYLSYGPGGLPYNILGWFVSAVILRSFSRDTLSTTVYASSADERRFLPASFPPRERGPRPRLGPHPVPQRQMDQLPKRDVSAELERRFEALARRNEQLVEMRMSVHERHTQALFVKSGREMHEVAKEMLGEVSHIHGTGDHSVHVVLAPSDCKSCICSYSGCRCVCFSCANRLQARKSSSRAGVSDTNWMASGP